MEDGMEIELSDAALIDGYGIFDPAEVHGLTLRLWRLVLGKLPQEVDRNEEERSILSRLKQILEDVLLSEDAEREIKRRTPLLHRVSRQTLNYLELLRRIRIASPWYKGRSRAARPRYSVSDLLQLDQIYYPDRDPDDLCGVPFCFTAFPAAVACSPRACLQGCLLFIGSMVQDEICGIVPDESLPFVLRLETAWVSGVPRCRECTGSVADWTSLARRVEQDLHDNYCGLSETFFTLEHRLTRQRLPTVDGACPAGSAVAALQAVDAPRNPEGVTAKANQPHAKWQEDFEDLLRRSRTRGKRKKGLRIGRFHLWMEKANVGPNRQVEAIHVENEVLGHSYVLRPGIGGCACAELLRMHEKDLKSARGGAVAPPRVLKDAALSRTLAQLVASGQLDFRKNVFRLLK